MIDIVPKSLFQVQRSEESKAWKELVNNPVTKSAITYAFAHFCTGPHTSEEIIGAKKFLVVLVCLADQEEEPKPMPSRELKSYA